MASSSCECLMIAKCTNCATCNCRCQCSEETQKEAKKRFQARLGNEIQDPVIRRFLHTIFFEHLTTAQKTIESQKYQHFSFGVWSGVVQSLRQMIETISLFPETQNKPIDNREIPFTTLVSSLDILRRSICSERTSKCPEIEFPLPSSSQHGEWSLEGSDAEKDAQYFLSLSENERVTWIFASFLLATKVEETLINTHLFRRALSLTVPNEDALGTLLTNIFAREQYILMILGFDIVYHIPHIAFLKIVEEGFGNGPLPEWLKHQVLRYLNIAILTGAVTIFQPISITSAALYLAIQEWISYFKSDDPLVSTAWWETLAVSYEEIPQVTSILIPVLNLLLPARIKQPAPGAAFFHILQPKRTIMPCRDLSEFKKVAEINKGTFGTVWKAIDSRKPGEAVAIKNLHNTFKPEYGGLPYYVLREILYLMRLNHPHIVHGDCVVVDNSLKPDFYLSMEFVESDVLRVLIGQKALAKKNHDKKYLFSLAQVKSILWQLLEAVAYLHDMNLLHRDLKTANVLITKEGVIKLADLGSIRDAGRFSLDMTMGVVTMWYRPPEILFLSKNYTSAVDIWSLGCLFYEILNYKPLFTGHEEKETLKHIIKKKGKPPPEVWEKCFASLPGAQGSRLSSVLKRYSKPLPIGNLLITESENCRDLFSRMLEWEPKNRITAREALAHPFFQEEPFPEPPKVMDGVSQSYYYLHSSY